MPPKKYISQIKINDKDEFVITAVDEHHGDEEHITVSKWTLMKKLADAFRMEEKTENENTS